VPIDTYEKICSEGDWYVWRAKIMGIFYEISQNNERIRNPGCDIKFSLAQWRSSLQIGDKLMKKLKKKRFLSGTN
jgi:hypothetical protein